MEDKILNIMRGVFGLQDIDTTVSQHNCPQWDSLHHLNLAAELENAFGIELEPEEIALMTDFAHIMATIRSKR